jgi:hypothetical protein
MKTVWEPATEVELLACRRRSIGFTTPVGLLFELCLGGGFCALLLTNFTFDYPLGFGTEPVRDTRIDG